MIIARTLRFSMYGFTVLAGFQKLSLWWAVPLVVLSAFFLSLIQGASYIAPSGDFMNVKTKRQLQGAHPYIQYFFRTNLFNVAILYFVCLAIDWVLPLSDW